MYFLVILTPWTWIFFFTITACWDMQVWDKFKKYSDKLLRTLLILKSKKFHVKPICFFIVFWWHKIALKISKLLIYAFIPLLLISFDLRSYSSEVRKRYPLRVLLMCLEVLGEWFSSLLERDWKGVSRKQLPLVKMHQ